MSEDSAPLPSPPTIAHAGPEPKEAGPAPESGPEWTDQVADLVVDVVDRVRDRTTGPVLKGASAVVYGLVALIVAVPVLVVGIILIGRLLSLIPGPLWIPYAVIGVVFVLSGLIVWNQRRPK